MTQIEQIFTNLIISPCSSVSLCLCVVSLRLTFHHIRHIGHNSSVLAPLRLILLRVPLSPITIGVRVSVVSLSAFAFNNKKTCPTLL